MYNKITNYFGMPPGYASKFLLTMKVLVIMMLTTVLQVRATTILAQKITLKERNAPLSAVIEKIRAQSGFGFVYSESLIDALDHITIEINNGTVEEALNLVLKDKPLSFTIDNKVVIIKAKTVNSTISRTVLVDSIVTGRVFDAVTRQGIAGVTVKAEGRRATAVTSENGSFKIMASRGVTLTFSFLGYRRKEVTVGNVNTVIDVLLEEAINEMKDVVVTGIFEKKTGTFTGAAQTITGEELKKVSAGNIFTGIAAYDPAFRIVPNNAIGGNINQLPEIQMRGQNSFPNLSGQLSANPNAPLFILDGFEVGLQRIVDMDMNMIASVTLLKDASATAIYGSRGANGVMVVTSIVPKPGKIRATFTNDYRFTTPVLSAYDMLDAAENLEFQRRLGLYNSANPGADYAYKVNYNERLTNIAEGINTDWLRLPVQNGNSNRSTLYLEGGDQNIRYGLQFSGDLQGGVMKGQDRNNYSGQFDLNYNVSKFQFRNSFRAFQNKSNESPYGRFSNFVSLSPYYSPYDANGRVNLALDTNATGYNDGEIINPMYDATLHTVNSARYFGIQNNFNLRYNATKFLWFESSFSLLKQEGGSDIFLPAQHSNFRAQTDINRRGSYTARNEDQSSYESLTKANFILTSGKNQINAGLGFNFSSQSNSFYQLVALGFPHDRLDNLLFAAQYQPDSRPTGDETVVRRVGLLFNGDYTFDNRFTAEVSVRRDGSSQYGSNRRFGTFWSTGLGWNIHNESFLKNSTTVNRLRLRGSFGSTGSTNIPAYGAQSRYTLGSSQIYYGELGAQVGNLANPLLGWQQVYKTNIGLDLGFFKDRLSLRTEMYRENTKNAVTTVALPGSVGKTSISENLGELQNTGFEFSARYQLINNPSKSLLWSVNVNGFTNRNILKKLSNSLTSAGTPSTSLPTTLLREGESINTIYAVRSLGVDPASGTEVYLDRNGNKTFTWNAADKVAVGIAQPKWNGNFGTNFSLKGLELNLIFNYQHGGQLYNSTLLSRVEAVDPYRNVDRRAYTLGWVNPGDVTQFMRITGQQQTTNLTSRFVQNDNQLNLSSASLGYNFFRTNLIKQLGLRSLSITASTNDIFTLSSIQIERGTDNPFARTYSLSLRVGF